jgi:hypothetical protein
MIRDDDLQRFSLAGRNTQSGSILFEPIESRTLLSAGPAAIHSDLGSSFALDVQPRASYEMTLTPGGGTSQPLVLANRQRGDSILRLRASGEFASMFQFARFREWVRQTGGMVGPQGSGVAGSLGAVLHGAPAGSAIGLGVGTHASGVGVGQSMIIVFVPVAIPPRVSAPVAPPLAPVEGGSADADGMNNHSGLSDEGALIGGRPAPPGAFAGSTGSARRFDQSAQSAAADALRDPSVVLGDSQHRDSFGRSDGVFAATGATASEPQVPVTGTWLNRSVTLYLTVAGGANAELGAAAGVAGAAAAVAAADVAAAPQVLAQAGMAVVAEAIHPDGFDGIAEGAKSAIRSLAEPRRFFHFARLGSPFTLLADSVGTFVEESSAIPAGKLGASLMHSRAWLVTLTVLAADVVLLACYFRRDRRAERPSIAASGH